MTYETIKRNYDRKLWTVTLHQHAQRLPYVDEVHLEGGVLPVGRRRSGLRSCRVRHDVAAWKN